jgi:hypothetical protein
MGKKVKTAIFDSDLRVKLKDYELSNNGNRVSIVKEGAGYFMPEIGPNTFLDWPIRKKYFLFGAPVYKRIYFSLKKGAKCVDFLTGVVYGPDTEQVEGATTNMLAEKIGKDNQQKTPWYIWPILIIGLFSLLLLLNMSGVLR